MLQILAALLGTVFLLKPKTAGAIPYGPFLPSTGLPVDGVTLDILARTIWGEARSEGTSGMQAVANVIMNRYKIATTNPQRARQWGNSVINICKKPSQFSAWNRSDPNYQKLISVTDADATFRTAKEIAMKALQFKLADLTSGAAFYHTKAVMPAWSKNLTPVTVIGAHKFFTASQVA